MNTFFTSDSHFGHTNIIKYSRDNLWSSAEEMDEFLIESWNSVVGKTDRVYHLGDFAWIARHGIRIRKRLNGHIRLIVGNHDDIPVLAASGIFQRIYLWRHFETSDKSTRIEIPFTASHIPLMKSQFRHGHEFNVHGHVHQNTLDSLHHVNICVEQTGYRPIEISELNKILERRLEFISKQLERS